MATSNNSSVTRKAGKKRKTGRNILLVLLVIFAAAGYFTLKPNTGSLSSGKYFYVYENTPYQTLLHNLKTKGFIKDEKSFDFVAKKLGLPSHVNSGRYEIKAGSGNLYIAGILRFGKQAPVKLVINKIRTKADLITLLSQKLEPTAADWQQLLNDRQFLAQYNLDTNTVICAFMQNTYELYWNLPAKKIFSKIAQSYLNYWTPDNKQLAKEQGLTPAQAVTLASIVEEETNQNDEKDKIASVYLNRLKKNMRLGADPTLKFAMNDFTVKRISKEMTFYDSPYNTYRHNGLPPGPICTPSASSINAVLHPAETNYLYFAAKSDFSGYHTFAETFDEHRANADSYRQALDDHAIHTNN